MQTETALRSPPELPRSQWAAHPNYPSQTLLLGSHANFLRVNAYLVEAAEERSSPAWELELLYRRWIGAMRSHEHYEEHKLYPYLGRRWSVSFKAAEEGHALLHEAHDAVIEAFAALRTDPASQEGWRTLKDALSAHERVLSAHLELEEELVIPLLLGLEREEFESYMHSSIKTLLDRF